MVGDSASKASSSKSSKTQGNIHHWASDCE